MRIRKGYRGLDRFSSARQGFLAPGAGVVVSGAKDEVVVNHDHHQVACISSRDDAPVATGTNHQSDLEQRANGTLVDVAGAELRAEVDPAPEINQLDTADGYSTRHPQNSDGVGLSISSIIQAGKGSPRNGSASNPGRAESVVTSDVSTSVTAKVGAADDCSPESVAMEEAPGGPETTLDQPALLLQSLKRVCTAAGNAGLTPKEAVAKILEQKLPGLNEGGERLSVQVAKSFRASSAFHEERGPRYFIVQLESPSVENVGVDSGNSSSSKGDRRESSKLAAIPSRFEMSSEIETAIEAARQLQSLQTRAPQEVGFSRRTRRVAPSTRRSKSSSGKASSSSQAGPRCNRDDGKGWRCYRPAESGFSLCEYHRDQIRRAETRRRRSRNKTSKGQIISPAASTNPPPNEENFIKIPQPDTEIDASADAPESVESDDGLPDQKRRRSVKAKSLKSIL